MLRNKTKQYHSKTKRKALVNCLLLWRTNTSRSLCYDNGICIKGIVFNCND